MDIREIVRLKPGTGGLEPPMNFGILLDREKTSKDHLAVVFTLNGQIKVKWKNIKESTGRIYHGPKDENTPMQKILREIIEKEKKLNILKKDPGAIQNDLDPSKLWTNVVRFIGSERTHLGQKNVSEDERTFPVLFDPEEIGTIYFEPYFLDPKQVWAVGRVLSASDDPREAYFSRVDIDNKPKYAPYRPETIKGIEDHISKLERLRSSYLQWEDIEDERTRKWRKVPKLKSSNIADVKLEEDLEQELENILAWAREYLENGRWRAGKNTLGLAGTPVTRMGKFDLERYMEFLALDLTRTKKGDLASNLVTLLLRFNTISRRTASELVVDHKIASGAQKFRSDFPGHVKDAAVRIPLKVEREDKQVRRDLTDLDTYTIDPIDAKDFDDAVSIVVNGNVCKVFVHIADVSHYVRPGDLIDSEARIRSTSVYLPTEVLPMLPRELSENICSLNEGSERLAMTTEMEIDSKTLELIHTDHFPSVIQVNKNLDYGTVDEYISKGKEPFSLLQRITEGLDGLDGRLNLDTSERKIHFTDDDRIELHLKRPSKATRMIETLMVRTNESVARFLEDRKVPNSYRVHPLPDHTSVEKFNSAAETLGLDILIDVDWDTGTSTRGGEEGSHQMLLDSLINKGKLTLGALSSTPVSEEEEETELNRPSLEDMQKAVKAFNTALERISLIEDARMRDLLKLRILRTMPRAFYSSSNIGHFGLNSLCYSHFTSPIRRYSDLVTHRALKAQLSVEGRIPQVVWENHSEDEIQELLETINDMSDDAERWEREMIDVALATRIEMDDGLRNGIHSGTVMSFTPSSAYVRLDDGATEGRLSIRHLAGDRLFVDEMETMVMIESEDSEEPYPILKLGDKVRCSIFATSIAEGNIELSLAQNLGISHR